MKNTLKIGIVLFLTLLLGFFFLSVASGIEVKQSTAVTLTIGPFWDPNGARATALTLGATDIQLSKNGAAFANKHEGTAPAHLARGMFSCNLDATDTSTPGILVLDVNDPNLTGTDPNYFFTPPYIYVLTGSAWNARYNASDPNLTDILTEIGAVAVTPADIWGYATRILTALDEDTTVMDLDATAVKVGSFSNNALTAAAIATNAFTSDELAASFIDEIEDDLLSNNKKKNSWGWWAQRSGGGDPLTISGTAQAGGTSNTIVLQADSSTDNNAYIPCTIRLLTGTGAPTNQIGLAYIGGTRTMTIAGTWPLGIPNATTTYALEIAPTSYFSAEGVGQGGTSNTIQLASGDVTADNLTGFVVLRSGTGSSGDVYGVRDSWDANDTLAITGNWSGASPDTTTYYAFTPTGSLVADTSTPGGGLTLADIQAAMTGQGYTSTRAVYLDNVNNPLLLELGLSEIGDKVVAGMDANSVVLAAIKLMTDLLAVVTTTVAVPNDANNFTITAGQDVNDAYWVHAIMVQDATDSHSEVRWIEQYVTSRDVTVDEPLSFTPEAGDKVWILGPVYGGFLYELRSSLAASKSPVYYFDRTGTTGQGAGDVTHYQQDGTDP